MISPIAGVKRVGVGDVERDVVERCAHYAPRQLAVESRTKPVAVAFRRDVEGRVCV
jgi:hypothetical protein